MNASQFTSRILARRGFTAQESRYHEPLPTNPLDLIRVPERLPDIGVATELVSEAISRKSTVGVFGDYDADGVTSAAIMTRFLRGHGVRVLNELASRSAGYGFNTGAATRLASSCDLVIVFDCGTSDEDSCQLVGDTGTRIIVVDHHTVPRDPGNHPADALLNPKRTDQIWPSAELPFTGLCSAGLSWILCLMVSRSRGDEPPMDLLWLAAIGTVADSAPLRWESRLLVRLGLESMNRNRPPVIAAMLRDANRAEAQITEQTVGWTIGPRLNAPGRMGSAAPALEALLTDSPINIPDVIARLGTINRSRQEAQGSAETMISEQGAMELPGCVVVAGHWLAGVSGIIASRLKDRYQTSAFALTTGPSGVSSGSSRGHGSASVYDALAHIDRTSPGTLLRWGGHRAASGFTVAPGRVQDFIDALETWVPDSGPVQTPVDAVWSPKLVRARGLRLAAASDKLAPFGNGFPLPMIRIPGAVIKNRRSFGMDTRHMGLRLRSGAQVYFWGAAKRFPGLRSGHVVDVTGTVTVGSWAGERFAEITAVEVVRIRVP
jgi:single-stranded-DNA-specific exonuclease